MGFFHDKKCCCEKHNRGKSGDFVEKCRRELCKREKIEPPLFLAKRLCGKTCGQCGKVKVFNRNSSILKCRDKRKREVFCEKMPPVWLQIISVTETGFPMNFQSFYAEKVGKIEKDIPIFSGIPGPEKLFLWNFTRSLGVSTACKWKYW